MPERPREVVSSCSLRPLRSWESMLVFLRVYSDLRVLILSRSSGWRRRSEREMREVSMAIVRDYDA